MDEIIRDGPGQEQELDDGGEMMIGSPAKTLKHVRQRGGQHRLSTNKGRL